jgi:hypothetical protein
LADTAYISPLDSKLQVHRWRDAPKGDINPEYGLQGKIAVFYAQIIRPEFEMFA